MRETWAYATGPVDGSKPDATNSAIIYREKWDRECPKAPLTGAWKSPRFMPRWASRITLRVLDVRVERVQEITGRDVLAEGVDNGKSNPAQGERWENMQRMAFEELWESINGKRAPWSSNPWTWVIQFERKAEA